MNRLAACALVLIAFAGTAEARLHKAWNYAELMKAADLVVIVTPGATTATGKQDAFPDITSVDPKGKSSPVMGERLETDLEVVTVMKGKALDVKGKASKRIVLHHYREVSTAPSVNGPGLVSFDPTQNQQYLMFLIREQDGRYAAVSGQTDPDMAIEVLQHRAP